MLWKLCITPSNDLSKYFMPPERKIQLKIHKMTFLWLKFSSITDIKTQEDSVISFSLQPWENISKGYFPLLVVALLLCDVAITLPLFPTTVNKRQWSSHGQENHFLGGTFGRLLQKTSLTAFITDISSGFGNVVTLEQYFLLLSVRWIYLELTSLKWNHITTWVTTVRGE